MKPSQLKTCHTITEADETLAQHSRPRLPGSLIGLGLVGLDKCELIMRIKLIPLLVIKRKQRHCLFNQNLNRDDNDYQMFL